MFDDKGFATEDCALRVFGVNENNEFAGSYLAQISIGTGLPAGAYPDEPPARRAGEAIIREGDKWVVVEDHRGETVYDTATRAVYVIRKPGSVPEGYTALAPASEYDRWNGSHWVPDFEAKHASDVAAARSQCQSLVDAANAFMNNRQWPGKAAIGRLNGVDLELYGLWLDYLDELNSVDIYAAPDVLWPEQPS
jgi:hypothetical protein